MFADLCAWSGRGNGAKFAADFSGGCWLHVEAVVLSESAGEEDVDAGFERRQGLRREGTGGCGRLGSECVQTVEVVRAKSQQRDAAGLNSGAPSKAGMPERTGVCCHDRGGS